MNNTNNYEDEATRNKYWQQAQLLMQESWYITDKPEGEHLYSSHTHGHLCKSLDLFFPLKKELWPEQFQNLTSNYLQIESMKWPDATTYCYMYDVIVSMAVPYCFINFGYVFVDNKLLRTTFFVIPNMPVEFDKFPHAMVIDPLADHWNVQPLYYIGCDIPKEYIQQWIKDKTKNPLELYIAGEEEKRLKKRNLDRYHKQIQKHPHDLSEDILKFAKRENLPVPEQKNEEEQDEDDDDDWAAREAQGIVAGSLRSR